MTPDQKTTIIIVSDLHLAAGTDPVSGRRDPIEPFVHDNAFARWLDHLRERAATSGDRHRLLLLGDIFDFPRVRLPGDATASAEGVEEMAIAKLDRIATGHPAFFAALGRWLGAGNPIDLVPGNHDVELMRPAVHRHLSGLLAGAAGLARPAPNLNVSPWIYHIPGVLYAEHGQQYHDLNSFPTLVWLEDGRPGVRDLPPGVAVDMFAQRATAKLGPEVDAPESISRLLRNVMRTGPRGVLRVAPDVVRLAIVIGRDLPTRWLPRYRARRERYRAAVLPDQARKTGLPVEVLARIDRMAESTANRMLARAATMGWQQLRLSLGSRGTLPPADYLLAAVSEIHRVLARSGVATAFYVVGHSHKAVQRPLGDGATRAVYFNGGAWSWQGESVNPLLTFVAVTWDPDGGEATAILQRWDDDLRRSEPIGAPVRVAVGPTGVDPV